MKTGLFILTLAFSLVTISCQNRARFEITNQTSVVIDSISIDPNQNFKEHYISLMPGETKKYTSNMSEIKSDGLFLISYKFQNQTKSHSLGYFSNGSQLQELIKVVIQPDTILVKNIF